MDGVNLFPQDDNACNVSCCVAQSTAVTIYLLVYEKSQQIASNVEAIKNISNIFLLKSNIKVCVKLYQVTDDSSVMKVQVNRSPGQKKENKLGPPFPSIAISTGRPSKSESEKGSKSGK